MGVNDGMNRRDFLRRATAGAAAGALGPVAWALIERRARAAASAPASQAAGKPNILVIMSDEHNAGVLGCYGDNFARTPSLDALAARGVLFENCYTNSPLCVPSRLSFTSGKYASRVGAWGNTCWLPTADYPSLPRILNAAGYESFLCGKMHYDTTCRYGFTEIGKSTFNQNAMTGLGGRRQADNLKAKPGLSSRFADFKAVEGDYQGNAHDRTVTEKVTGFLAGRKAEDKPFFMLAGYICPHFPLREPKEFWDHFKGKVPMPKIPDKYLETLPLNYKHLRATMQITDVPEEIVRFGRELYYGLTEWVDAQIGQVLAALAKTPLADNTIVIYTTDHGESMGEHGMWWKCCMFEHSSRVPLIVSLPQRWKGAQRRKGACSLVDVVQTIAELGGAKCGDDWNGTSLAGLLDSQQSPWKDLAVSEFYSHGIASGYTMVRTGSHKYVYHVPPDAKHPAQRELYDLDNDPGEFENLAGNDKHKDLIASLHEAMVKEVGENPDKTELRCRADYAKGYGRQDVKNTGTDG